MAHEQDEAYFQYLSEFYARSPQYTTTLPAILQGRRVSGKGLDIGCGMGYTIALLQRDGHWVAGVDINHPMLTYGRERLQASTTAEARATHLPFKDASFDWVLANQVIEHIEDYQTFLNEILRVLKVGGTMLISTPNRFRFIRPWRPVWSVYGLLGKIKEDPTHVHEFTYYELKKLVGSRFLIHEMRCTGTLLSTTRFAMSLEQWPRGLSRLLAANFDVVAEKRADGS